MPCSKRRILIAIVIVLALAGGVSIGHLAILSFFYPEPENMPPIVSETTEQLLMQFQAVLKERDPEVLRSLQPGLSEGQIFELEKKGGFTLSSDLRELYQWRNGSKDFQNDLIPGKTFLPLEKVVAERIAIRDQLKAASLSQRVAFFVFAEYTKTWVHILDDGAGDGYFYDPERIGTSDVFFYHMMEDGYYIFFPSFRNFLKGAIECYEQEIFTFNSASDRLEGDYYRSMKVWQSLGSSNM